MLVAGFFAFYKSGVVPPCVNADEAAFGYNAYSILKTGADEYGSFLPLRLTSFGDNKLPLLSYLIIPSVAFLGLDSWSIRLPNLLLAIAFVPLMFAVSKQLFSDDLTALTSAALTSASIWIFIIMRQTHEAGLSAFLILASIYFLLRFERTAHVRNFIFSYILIFLSTFAYHTSRFFFLATVIILLGMLFKKGIFKTTTTRLLSFSVLVILSIIPFLIDLLYGASRVSNLIFYRTDGFMMTITEYLTEHPNRLIHNKAIEGLVTFINNYFVQFSPEFLISGKTENLRFGYEGINLITPIELILIFFGFYFLYKNRQKNRHLITIFFFLSPLPAAFTWQQYTLSRIYFLIFPAIWIIAYAVKNIIEIILTSYRSSNKIIKFIPLTVFLSVIFVHFLYVFHGLDIYFNHYSKRSLVSRSWQCGYDQLASYVRDNYNKYDKFVISERFGQPYIFMLYYLQYNPVKFQQQAALSERDEYGFSTVKAFDKFDFEFEYEKDSKNIVYIGFPDQFDSREIDQKKLKKINILGDDIFWIYET